jgi:hypothetical protein
MILLKKKGSKRKNRKRHQIKSMTSNFLDNPAMKILKTAINKER